MTVTEKGRRGDIEARTRSDADRWSKAKPASFWRSLALVGSVGWPIAGGAVAGAFLGRALDRAFDTGIHLTLIGLVLATAAGTFAALRSLRKP